MNIKSIVSMVSRLSKRERTILYVTLGVLSIVLLDRVIVSPILVKINNLGEAITDQEEAIEQSLLIVTQEARIKKESGRYAPFLSKPQAEEKIIAAFLKEVETLAKKSAIYLTDIKPSGQGEEGAAKQYFLKIAFEAQMEQVFNFFYNVTNFEQLIKVEGYQIKSKFGGSSVVTCTMSISKTIVLK